ncbi:MULTISPECIES: LrgB family protein [Pseudomonadota]|uniref:Putative murein hydrolase (TIGR00659 family) n=1 Tax=Eoetvoesiella caeni TaxID=645616 RepID=A0A366H2Q2_9BURK|nr:MULTISPECIES: LrgB family protein [Pseudomonadota]KWR81554.1 hypothetical protein RN02_10325 [Pseudomonas sp. PI1]MCI2811167.1 LrgB family protein [Eoetvoesiella caeni]NYT57044.1 LrgB family protein [Eoetvoesiella caeni]RBP35055.1 putative murein hydrolase (TIGR00659 family) [Eoetvoesiella caeni]
MLDVPWLLHSPWPWLPVTMAAYALALWIYRRSGALSLLIPVLTAASFVVALLALFRIPYTVYASGTSVLGFLLGPATVALAIPLYEQLGRLRQIWFPLTVALLVGCVTAILSAVAIGWSFGASLEMLMSLAAKSATMPIAIPVSERVGGVPALAALAVAVTGVAGAILARPSLLDVLAIRDPAARGFSIGVTAHAIGMARELEHHPHAGAFAALGMGLNGIATALLVPVVVSVLPLAGLR